MNLLSGGLDVLVGHFHRGASIPSPLLKYGLRERIGLRDISEFERASPIISNNTIISGWNLNRSRALQYVECSALALSTRKLKELGLGIWQ